MRVGAGKYFAVDLLQRDEVSRLSDADRRLTTEIVMGVLRWQGALDGEIEELSGKPVKYFDSEVLTILRMAVYQILFLARIPERAAVSEAVELTKSARKRSASGLVNAVLRKCTPGEINPVTLKKSLRDAATRAFVRRMLPDWLFDRWTRRFGTDAAIALALASAQIPPTTLRAREGQRGSVARRLAECGIRTTLGKFSLSALIVHSGDVHASEMLRGGEVAIQDEASQLVAGLLAPRRGDRVLDLCAAPGMKTGKIAEALGEGALHACDVSAPRVATMKRLLRSAIPRGVRLHLARLDATRPLPFGASFDRILVDAPCSGTGTLGRNPEIKWRLRPEEFERLSKIQATVLVNALAVLAPGGRLVYATCSLEPEENETVVEKTLADSPDCRLLGKEELKREFLAWADLFDASGYFRTRPDLHEMDGFFAAVIHRASR